MVECGCWVVVVVCGQPGMFVVVEVTCGRRGGRWWLRWWLWDEEGSHVTVCDACDFGSRTRACAHTQIHTIYNCIASIIQFCSV